VLKKLGVAKIEEGHSSQITSITKSYRGQYTEEMRERFREGGRIGGRASAAGLLSSLGVAGYRQRMADLGRAGGRAVQAALKSRLGEAGFRQHHVDLGRAGGASLHGINTEAQDKINMLLRECVESTLRSQGFGSMTRHKQLTTVKVSERSSCFQRSV